jgi:hypothetical protein
MRTLVRAVMRTRFSKTLWDRWLAQLAGPDENDPQVKWLRAGIAHFRTSLAEQERRNKLLAKLARESLEERT